MQPWSDALRLGVEEIDAQHKAIFEVCARLNSAVADGEYVASSDLAFLGRYVEEHFAHEEELMRATGYPQADGHQQEHARYRESLTTLLARPMSELGFLQEVALSVTSWLVFHIQHEDRALAAHVARQQGA